jgi:hypothetical protein
LANLGGGGQSGSGAGGRGIMTRYQQIAIDHPCIEAEDCARPIYKHYKERWSVILTVNSGFE